MKLISRTIPDLYIEDINKVTISKDDVLILHVDYGNLPVGKRNEYADLMREGMKIFFPDNRVMIFDKTIKLTVATLVP